MCGCSGSGGSQQRLRSPKRSMQTCTYSTEQLQELLLNEKIQSNRQWKGIILSQIANNDKNFVKHESFITKRIIPNL